MPTRPSRYVAVEGVRVDVGALSRLQHRCRPHRCRARTSCCSSYEVFVDRREMDRITGYLGDAARYAGGLREEGDFVDPFEDTEGGSCLATDEEGRCVFAYQHRRGHLLCSLHSAALDRSRHPYEVKPFACSIWPLFYVDSEPPLLTVQDDAAGFPCNVVGERAGAELDPGVASILRDVWGEPFLAGVERALRQAFA